jgi:hypothetical protein
VTTEEFACNDITKSIRETDWMDYRQKEPDDELPWLRTFPRFGETLNQEGTLIVPTTAQHYLKTTQAKAKANPLTRDDQVSYKGWTGGTPQQIYHQSLGHQCFERLNACFNVTALLDTINCGDSCYKQLVQLWKAVSMANYVSFQWSTPSEERMNTSKDLFKQTLDLYNRVAERLLAHAGSSSGLHVANMLGWQRSGLIEFDDHGKGSIKDDHNRIMPQQALQNGRRLCWVEDIPAFGLKTWKWIKGKTQSPAFSVKSKTATNGSVVLENKHLSVQINPDGTFTRSDHSKLNRIWAMLPEKDRREEPSLAEKPLNLACYEPLSSGTVEIIETGPARASARVLTTWPHRPDVRVEILFSLAAGADTVQCSVKMDFDTPHTIADTRFRGGAEGQYLPGVVVTFPDGNRSRDLVTDQPYCIATNVLDAGGREIWTHLPFRNWTARGLGMAASESGSIALVAKGLVHYFQVPWKQQNLLGLSLGLGPGEREKGYFSGTVQYDYAIQFYDQTDRLERAWLAAREGYTPLYARLYSGNEKTMTQSLASSSSSQVPVTGVDRSDEGLVIRLVNLSNQPNKTELRIGDTPPNEYKLPSRAVREYGQKI